MNAAVDLSGVVLETERLILRPWKRTDLYDLYEYARVDGVGQMAGWEPHRDLAESARILSYFIDSRQVFALEHRGKVIGSLGVDRYSEKNFPELSEVRGREIGYVLSKEYWGLGLMPEAVQAVIRYLFETEKLDFLICGYFERNHRSRRVVEKCGFQYVKSNTFEAATHILETSLDYILWNPARAPEDTPV